MGEWDGGTGARGGGGGGEGVCGKWGSAWEMEGLKRDVRGVGRILLGGRGAGGLRYSEGGCGNGAFGEGVGDPRLLFFCLVFLRPKIQPFPEHTQSYAMLLPPDLHYIYNPPPLSRYLKRHKLKRPPMDALFAYTYTDTVLRLTDTSPHPSSYTAASRASSVQTRHPTPPPQPASSPPRYPHPTGCGTCARRPPSRQTYP